LWKQKKKGKIRKSKKNQQTKKDNNNDDDAHIEPFSKWLANKKNVKNIFHFVFKYGTKRDKSIEVKNLNKRFRKI